MDKVPQRSSPPPPRPLLAGGTSFSLLGIPIHVSSSFWIVAVLFGAMGIGGTSDVGRSLAYAVAWSAIVFVSIVLHELGHALTARAFGAKPTITLHAMGGLTHFEGTRMSRPASWLVSFAGPATGLALGTLLWAATRTHSLGPVAGYVVGSALWVNIGWSFINLMPVVPFDGGHMLAAFFGPRRALWTAVISALVGTAITAVSLYFQGPWIWVAVLFGSATVSSLRHVRQIWLFGADRKAGLDAELLKARAAVARGDTQEALSIGENVVAGARTPLTKNGGVLVLAWAQATLGRTVAARELIERLEAGTPVDAYLLAAVEDALGAPERASARLESARQAGMKDADAVKLLIDLYARDGQLTRAIEVATQDVEVLGRDASLAVLTEGMARNAYVASADLAARMFQAFGHPEDALAEARASALGGEGLRALRLLEKMAQGGRIEADAIRSDAAFASLRGDDRFEELLRST